MPKYKELNEVDISPKVFLLSAYLYTSITIRFLAIKLWPHLIIFQSVYVEPLHNSYAIGLS